MSTFYSDNMYGNGKKTGLKIAGIVGVVAVLAGGCAIAYGVSDTIKNQVKLAFSKPDDYFEWVYEKNTTDLADSIAANYQKSLDQRDEGMNFNAELRYEPTQEFRDELVSEFFGYSDDSRELQEAIDIIKGADSVALSMDMGVRGNAFDENMAFKLNDNTIMSVEAAADFDQSYLAARVPDLTERWLSFDFSAAMEEMLDGENISLNRSDWPEAQEFADTVKKYSLMAVKDMHNVTVEKKSPVQISGISTEYTAMTAELTADQFLNTLQAVVDAASADETLKKLTPDAASFQRAMLDAGDSIRQLREYDLSGTTLKYVTYVDATGTIRGHYITAGSDFAYFGAIGMEGDAIGGELKLSASGKKLFGAKLDATRDGLSFSGQAVITAASSSGGDDETVTLNFSDFQIVDLEKAYCSGTFTIEMPYAEIESITVDLSSDGSSQTIAYHLTVDEFDAGDLKLVYAFDKGGDVAVPDRSGAYELGSDLDDFDIMEYVDESALTQYVKDVASKLGFSQETCDKLDEAFS